MNPTTDDNDDVLVLYGQPFASRLLLGTARYPSPDVLEAAVQRACPAMLTASLRRQTAHAGSAGAAGSNGFWDLLRRLGVPVLPNTAGCHGVQEAIATAHMARELFDTPWIKLELIGDDYTLQPDTLHLVDAASQLIRDGFRVLPYWCCASGWSTWVARPSCRGPRRSVPAGVPSIRMRCNCCANASTCRCWWMPASGCRRMPAR
jgi:thiazole synthase ThiGH ThiG subunit